MGAALSPGQGEGGPRRALSPAGAGRVRVQLRAEDGSEKMVPRPRYCVTFQPSTTTTGAAPPSDSTEYRAATSRFSPGKSVKQLSSHKIGRTSSPPWPLVILRCAMKARLEVGFAIVTWVTSFLPWCLLRLVTLTFTGGNFSSPVRSA